MAQTVSPIPEEYHLVFKNIEDVKAQGYHIHFGEATDGIISNETLMRIIREETGPEGAFTVKRLAGFLNYSHSALWAMFKKPSTIPLGVARKMATILEISVEELFPYDDEAFFHAYPYINGDISPVRLDLETMETVSYTTAHYPAYNKGKLFYDIEKKKAVTKESINTLKKKLKAKGIAETEVTDTITTRFVPRFVMIGKFLPFS